MGSLLYILTALFLHFSWAHIEGNSGPLFIFGFLAAYRGIGKFAAVTVIVVLTSGFAAWFFEPAGVGAGASGVVFGYFGYIMVRGLFDRHAIDVLIGAFMALCFAYQFAVLLPQQGIGWQAHVGGLVGGVLSGWLLRDRRAIQRAPKPAVAGAAGTAVLPAERGSLTAPATCRKAAKPGKSAARTQSSIRRTRAPTCTSNSDDLGHRSPTALGCRFSPGPITRSPSAQRHRRALMSQR